MVRRRDRGPRCRARAADGRPCLAEILESRTLLSLSNFGSPPYTPAELRHAYGADTVAFGSLAGDGRGQTIAVIAAYDNPHLVSTGDPHFVYSDLHAFDVTFGLPDPPSFLKLAADGSQHYPPPDPAGPSPTRGSWAAEAALDLEWAHAFAPAANLLLVEAASSGMSDVFAAIDFARHYPGVSVVSMSFGTAAESSAQLAQDATFTTPAGHNGVTFVAASGDAGAPGGFAAFSPNVLAVGATTLALDRTATRVNETGWRGSGGGLSIVEPKPAFQTDAGIPGSTRATPDVSIVGDPSTGVYLYDSWDNPQRPLDSFIGGTSLSAPLWAGLIAVADQGRALYGATSLDGATQTLPELYNRPSSTFFDVTTGNNGLAAGPGFDLVTGLGTPLADRLVPSLALSLPVGFLDTAASSHAVLAGWAYDGDLGSSAVTLHIYVDGQLYTTPGAGLPRPDLASLPGIHGTSHGFSISLLGLSPGVHTVDVWALDNQGGPALRLGRQYVTSSGLTGSLDTADAPNVGAVGGTSNPVVAGWAYDPSQGALPVTVTVYIDGAKVAELSANLPRPDVPRALPTVRGANHGFVYTLTGLSPGRHTVRVYVPDDSGGLLLLGTQTLFA